MTNTAHTPVLVIGSTGKTGRRVAAQLAARKIPVRHGSRSAAIPFDWDNAQTWGPALAGVGSAYLTYYPDIAVPGSVKAIKSLAEAAKAAGVKRLVLLSGRGEEEAERCEDVVRAAGLEWVIIRSTWFAQNFSEGNFLDELRTGALSLPVADVPEPFVDADDIADVAVAALTEDRHVGQTYELTGPRLLTFSEAVAEIGLAAARPLKFVSVPADAYVAALPEYGVPPEVIELLTYLFTTVLDGRNAHLADGVQRALGRPPRDFAEFAKSAAATGVWNNPAE
jgi:uncharacterized protein YbjT (DUF2867 family)